MGTCQSTLTGVIPEGLDPWGNTTKRILLLEDGRTFSLHFPSGEEKKGRQEGRRERKRRKGQERRKEERRKVESQKGRERIQLELTQAV